MPDSHTFDAPYLTRVTRDILHAAGTPTEMAAEVARILVNANLTGHDSHGLLRVPTYCRQIEAGGLKPAVEPVVTADRGTCVQVDTGRGWGHYAAKWAMEFAIERAKETGSAYLTLANCNHIGRLGEYAEMAAAAGCIGTVTVGVGGDGLGGAAPFGGTKRALGTNPMAFGVPTEGDIPFVIDFATTVCAEGKLQVARSKGADLPPGCVVDAEGDPSVKPSAYYEGGSLLHMGGHKGYALSLYMCLLGALGSPIREDWTLHGATVQAIDVTRFRPLEEYQRDASAFLRGMKSIPAREGQEILSPGELEARSRQERLARGIQVPAVIWSQIGETAEKLGVRL